MSTIVTVKAHHTPVRIVAVDRSSIFNEDNVYLYDSQTTVYLRNGQEYQTSISAGRSILIEEYDTWPVEPVPEQPQPTNKGSDDGSWAFTEIPADQANEITLK
jgi:hypothetical protein